MGRRDDEAQGDQIVARDRVLHGCLDVRQGADEAAEDGDDGVDARDGAECAAVPGDVGREVVAGAFRVATGEDFGDVLAAQRSRAGSSLSDSTMVRVLLVRDVDGSSRRHGQSHPGIP